MAPELGGTPPSSPPGCGVSFGSSAKGLLPGNLVKQRIEKMSTPVTPEQREAGDLQDVPYKNGAHSNKPTYDADQKSAETPRTPHLRRQASP